MGFIISKVELKKQLQELGILVQDKYVRKSDIEAYCVMSDDWTSRKTPRRPIGKVVEWKKPLYRGINQKYDKTKDSLSPGFYGYGAYFTTEADGMRGSRGVEYRPIRPLRILIHEGKVLRGDYLSSLKDDLDGIWFKQGAEGGEQMLLRSFSLVKKVKEIKNI